MHIPDKREKEVAVRYFAPFVKIFEGRSSVLEIASGRGYFLDMLKEAGIRGTGVELDSGLCATAQERGLDVVNADFFQFLKNAAPGSYDGCFASHIVEHLLPVQVEEMFSLVNAAMKPGSPFVIITPNIANMRRSVGDFWRDPSHVRPYPTPALTKLLVRRGWEIDKTGEHTDRKPSIVRTIIYSLRNMLIGSYWVGDDVYVVARKP